MKIATIYNDEEHLNIEVHWDPETGKITYHVEDGRVEDADETAETLQKAVDDTYDRYRYGWYLEFEELEGEVSKMTPEEFYEKMLEVQEKFKYDPEQAHIVMDGIMCKVLETLGYEKGVSVFDKTYKYYA